MTLKVICATHGFYSRPSFAHLSRSLEERSASLGRKLRESQPRAHRKRKMPMESRFEITKDTMVSEVNRRYPQCAQVFEEMGMGGCGGKYGPNEPLWLFAQAHRVDVNELISKLKDAIENPQKFAKHLAPAVEDSTYFVPFVKSAILVGIFLGVAFGLYNLIIIGLAKSYTEPSYAAIQAHGHAQFFGWVGLMIMGIAPFVLPRFKNVRFRYAQILYVVLALMLIGIVVQAFTRPFAEVGINAELTFASAIIELFAILIWVVIILLVYWDASLKLEAFDGFILAGASWFLLAGVLNAIMGGIMLRERVGAIDAPINLVYLSALSFGLAGNMIFGVAIRALPSLMGVVKSYRPARLLASLVLYNGGIVLRAVAPEASVVGSFLIFVGGFIVIWELGIFGNLRKATTLPGTHNSYRLLVFYSFIFFLIASAMLVGADLYKLISGSEPPHEYVGAFRHAITVGFITAMILGFGYRILPIFAGSYIPSFKLQVISVWLLMIGNAWRILFELLTLTGNSLAFRLMPASGGLELLAILIFGYLIWKTLSVREEVEEGEISANTKIAHLLDTYPWAREELISAGLYQLAVIHRPPPFVSLKMACTMHKLDVDEVVETLRRAKQKYDENKQPGRDKGEEEWSYSIT